MKSFLICIGLDPDHSEPIIQHPLVVNPVTLEIPDGICYILYLFPWILKPAELIPFLNVRYPFPLAYPVAVSSSLPNLCSSLKPRYH